jgi:hypothetical protein
METPGQISAEIDRIVFPALIEPTRARRDRFSLLPAKTSAPPDHGIRCGRAR